MNNTHRTLHGHNAYCKGVILCDKERLDITRAAPRTAHSGRAKPDQIHCHYVSLNPIETEDFPETGNGQTENR